jgi:hypothetical protein
MGWERRYQNAINTVCEASVFRYFTSLRVSLTAFAIERTVCAFRTLEGPNHF